MLRRPHYLASSSSSKWLPAHLQRVATPPHRPHLLRRAVEDTAPAELDDVVMAHKSAAAAAEARALAAEARALALETDVAAARDQLLRLNADFENFRRRMQTEKEQLADSVRGDMVVSLLPMVDNFELARTQVMAETEGEQRINSAYQSLYVQLVTFLRGLGVEAVPSVGAPFDPAIHEAIMKEPNVEVADETVLQEFRKGFRLGGRLLRPAMVKVSISEMDGSPQEAAE